MLAICAPEPSGSSTDSCSDYTQFFTTDKIFESRSDVLASAQNIGKQHGIIVVTIRSDSATGQRGHDDMPAHIKSSMFGCALTIPITNGKLNMGTWQGIWLCEHRDHPTSRRVVVTLNGI